MVTVGFGLYFYSKPKENVNLKVVEAHATNTIYQVALSNGKADPNELIIHTNDKVQFNSRDGKSHNIAQGRGNDYGQAHEHAGGVGAIESGNFRADEAYLVYFKKAGTYYFHDHLDPNIFITILVY